MATGQRQSLHIRERSGQGAIRVGDRTNSDLQHSTIETDMDKFSYKGKAEIRHLNVRKEGPDEEKVLAIDIKFQCVTGADVIDFFHEGLKAVLFTDVGAVKNMMLKPLAFYNTVMNCDLEVIGQRFGGIEVGKFTLAPKDGNQVTMTFSLSIQPSGDEVARFSEFVMDEIDISIQPQPELDFGGAQEAAANLSRMAAEDGYSVDVTDSSGNVLASFGDPEQDPFYEQAVQVVRKQQRVSISLVQRHLRIGYNRAARLIEEMERLGVVSPMANDGTRSILKAAA